MRYISKCAKYEGRRLTTPLSMTSLVFDSAANYAYGWDSAIIVSGGFRNSERGFQPLAREARRQIFGLPRPLSVALKVRTEYLEATLGIVKCLEISKELIRECVIMPGCCCSIPLLHNHLMDSCSYVRKNTLLTPPESATDSSTMQLTA